METASKGIKHLLKAIATDGPAVTLLTYSRQLQDDHVEDIELFIFGIRAFFCAPHAADLRKDAEAVEFIRSEWMKQNDEAYNDWLASTDDAHHSLKWEKWTFQAKNMILDEFLAA